MYRQEQLFFDAMKPTVNAMMKHRIPAVCFVAGFVLALAGCVTGNNGKDLASKELSVQDRFEMIATMAEPKLPEGKPLHCRATEGAARFDGDWHEFAEYKFDIRPGQRMLVELPHGEQAERKTSVRLRFEPSGQKLVFCPVLGDAAAPDEPVSCASIYALEDDFYMGVKRTLDVPDAVRGGILYCAYDGERPKPVEEPGPKLRDAKADEVEAPVALTAKPQPEGETVAEVAEKPAEETPVAEKPEEKVEEKAAAEQPVETESGETVKDVAVDDTPKANEPEKPVKDAAAGDKDRITFDNTPRING